MKSRENFILEHTEHCIMPSSRHLIEVLLFIATTPNMRLQRRQRGVLLFWHLKGSAIPAGTRN